MTELACIIYLFIYFFKLDVNFIIVNVKNLCNDVLIFILVL